MRRRLPILACALAALTIPGCASNPFAGLFPFGGKSSTRMGASDSLGARMMAVQTRAKQSGKAKFPTQTPASPTATAAAPE